METITVVTLLTLLEGSLLIAVSLLLGRVEGWRIDPVYHVAVGSAALFSLSQSLAIHGRMPEPIMYGVFTALSYGVLILNVVLASRWMTARSFLRLGWPLLALAVVLASRPDRPMPAALDFAFDIVAYLWLAQTALRGGQPDEPVVATAKRNGIALYWLSSVAGLLLMWILGDGTVSGGLVYNAIALALNCIVLAHLLFRLQMEGSLQPARD